MGPSNQQRGLQPQVRRPVTSLELSAPSSTLVLTYANHVSFHPVRPNSSPSHALTLAHALLPPLSTRWQVCGRFGWRSLGPRLWPQRQRRVRVVQGPPWSHPFRYVQPQRRDGRQRKWFYIFSEGGSESSAATLPQTPSCPLSMGKSGNATGVTALTSFSAATTTPYTWVRGLGKLRVKDPDRTPW